ncbi:MAG: c-type cytochrome [Planctomycetaceae bacterium]
MPATDAYIRDLKKVHVVFALCCAAMFATTIWMMAADQKEEWTEHQRTFEKIQDVTIERSKAQIQSSPEYQQQSTALKKNLETANNQLSAEEAKLNEARSELKKAEMAFDMKGREVRGQRAIRDKARADYDLDVRDTKPAEILKKSLANFTDEQNKVDVLERELQELEAKRNAAQDNVAALTKNRDEITADLKKLNSDVDRMDATLKKIDPSGFSGIKKTVMEWPIINGFNSPLKIQQDWLPNLKIRLGMAQTARFDRCRTCHIAADRVEAGNVPSFPFGHPETASVEDWVTQKQFPHPYATHPRPDLFLTASSPHQLGKFGCTTCHEGQGSGTSFTNASHTPNDPHIDHEWKHDYGYHSNHFWEYPMLPKRFQESSSIKCHHQVVELGTHPTFGASAPKVVRGMELVQKYGCFGCHEIHGFDGLKPIGPDLRLEPQTEAERTLAEADPSQRPGQMRKVGPALKHIKAKTTQQWTEYWTEEPKRFRPETRMPQFFKLSNLQDHQALDLQPVELAGIAQYLFDKSQPLELMTPKEGYKADAEYGKKLFAEKGCLACHTHEAFPEMHNDFGPNLSNIAAKIKPGSEGTNWVYTWIQDPERHHPRTRMPKIALEADQKTNKDSDPAADIAAFLLKGSEGQGDKYEGIQVDDKKLDELVVLFLNKALKLPEVPKAMEERKYPLPKEQVKGDEIELVRDEGAPRPSDAEWRQMKLNYVGRRTISRYGCYGCHDIDGFEQARPIGTTLQDWGRKDTSRLAFEHIHEFLHHDGKPAVDDPKNPRPAVPNTLDRVESAMKKAQAGGFEAGEFASKEDEEAEMRAAFFTESLLHHGRPGFLWQKLRDPRSYDHEKIETKGYDERLRMPQFPLKEDEIEAIATFVLGLIADPPADEYIYRPTGSAAARIEGERLLNKFNCTGCHMVDLPEIHYGVDLEEVTATELAPADHPDAHKMLLKLKPPVNGLTGKSHTVGTGEEAKTLPVVKFKGLVFGRPDPEDDPADQEFTYDLWETLDVAGKQILPGTRMLVPGPSLVPGSSKTNGYTVPGRGGEFAEWLVDSLTKSTTNGNPQLAWQMSPPPLYKEGIKVQTPWLYQFLKEPYKLRHTTVVRMPKFNMSDAEARALANYFAAVDGAEFPYQRIAERDSGYLDAKTRELHDVIGNGPSAYLNESWKVLTDPSLCIKCHSVSGKQVQIVDPQKDIRGPNLEHATDRLRPDWAFVWIAKPSWMLPYTSMPVNFPKNAKTLPQLFEGEATTQVIAVRDALMNYHRMMEQEAQVASKGRPNPQPAPAAPAREGNGEESR